MRGGGALHGQARQCTGSGSACGGCQWTVHSVVGEGGAENDSKHSKSQLKVSGMDEFINHKYHVYFISTGIYTGVNTVNNNGHTYHVNINCIANACTHTYCTCFEMHHTFLTVISLTS